MMEKFKFFVSYSLSNLRRGGARCLIFAVMLSLVSAALLCSLEISTQYHAFYQSETRRLGQSAFADEETVEYMNSVVYPADSAAGFMNVAALVFSILGAAAVCYIGVAALRERRFEYGILYACGFRRGYIAASAALETCVLAAMCELAGGFLCAAALWITGRLGAVKLRPIPNIRVFIAVCVVSAVILISLAAAFSLRMKKMPPQTLIGRGGE